MAGGNFNLSSPKVRPGTYVNVINGRQPTAGRSPVGIGMIPLIGYDWGPREKWIHLTSESPDAAKSLLGRSIYDDSMHMLMIRLMFMNATEVYVYIPDGKGEAAKADVELDGEEGTAEVTAKYAGALGNGLKIASVANPTGGFDISIVLNGTEVELLEGLTDISELSASAYVETKKTGKLKAFASVSLAGGSNGESETQSITTFLDAAEKIKFNCMAFPTTEESLITALTSKIKYIRNSIGWKCHAIVVKTKADAEGIWNLTNSFEIEGMELDPIVATAWLAGADAGASYTTSLTYKVVEGATAVVGELSNEKAIEAIKAGETFFTVDENGNVILEYDVNSKVTFKPEDPVDIYKGRPCRVYDSFANDLLITFVPGKFNNNAEGWSVMEGLGRAMLQSYADDGAIQNVNLEEDFVVDQGRSIGDSVYINVGIQSVDSAEKYYFTVVAR